MALPLEKHSQAPALRNTLPPHGAFLLAPAMGKKSRPEKPVKQGLGSHQIRPQNSPAGKMPQQIDFATRGACRAWPRWDLVAQAIMGK